MDTHHEVNNITKNLKVIEWLKADLLVSLSALFKGMLKGSEDAILDAMASLIITCYLLGRRLGFGFSRIDLRVESKLKQSLDSDHEIEKWYGDLSALLRHTAEKKR